MTSDQMFQSTLLREERHGVAAIVASITPVSIHAPARGATAQGRTLGPVRFRFNPRSCARSDPSARSDGKGKQKQPVHAKPAV